MTRVESSGDRDRDRTEAKRDIADEHPALGASRGR
jgi:hypothetical protein